MTIRDRFKERLKKQGEKLDLRFKDRPISREKYENLMAWVTGAVIAYLVISFLCVIKVIGEWLT